MEGKYWRIEYGCKMDGGKVLADKFLCCFLILVGSDGYLNMLFLKLGEQLLDTGVGAT